MSDLKEQVGKEIAARANSGEVIGVGTGSTVDAAICALAGRVRDDGLNIQIVPTSLQTAWACEEAGLTVLYPGYRGEIRWGFDGADAVNSKRQVIKGAGAAMLQEKILAARCKDYIIVVDESKVVDDIATKCAVPVEVIPEAISIVEKGLAECGASEVNLRIAKSKHGPVITEGGNLVLDAHFAEIGESLENDIASIVGAVESGLFLNYATEVLVGAEGGIQTI